MLMLFLKEIRHRWVIHLLIVFLMACIVSILVIQISVNSSAEETINEISHDLGQGMLVVPEGTDLEAFYGMKFGPHVMPDDYGDLVKASPTGKHARRIEPKLYGNISIKGEEFIIVGQKMQLPSTWRVGDAYLTLGDGAAERLGLKVGDRLDIQDIHFEVFRILSPSPKGYDTALFIPLREAQTLLGKPGKINALRMGGCWCKLDIPAFATEVENILPGTMAITVDGMAKAQIQINETMERYSVVLWTSGAIIAIGTIVFLILYTIRRGAQEIGLLLSIGLSPAKIMVKNIVVSVVTAVAGVFFGYMLSVPLMSWFGKVFMGIGLIPSWHYLWHFVLVSLVIALFASSFPSWFVTRLDPTKLLREE